MNKIFDLLASDKNIFVFFEKAMLRMDDGMLVALQGHRGKEYIAPASHLILFLGAGTSISQEAAIFCAQHDLHIAIGRGRSNIHSFWMEGRYSNPQIIMQQCENIQQHKLQIAKWLMEYRLRRHQFDSALIEDMKKQKDLTNLVAWEGRWAKNVYKMFSVKHRTSFSRNFDSLDPINHKLNLLNNALYSICSAVALSCNLHPSLGFIHGASRRGGLAFDLADILKNDTTLPIAFDNKIPTGKLSMYALNTVLLENQSERIRTLIRLCLLLGASDMQALENFCACTSH